MPVLVICRPVPGGDQDDFRQLVAGETAALRDLKAKGILTGAWSPLRLPGWIRVSGLIRYPRSTPINPITWNNPVSLRANPLRDRRSASGRG